MAHDFTVEVAPVCESVQSFSMKVPSSDGKREYRVEFGPTPYGRYQHDWSCECVGFQTRRTCKHVEAAKKARCGWNRELEPRATPVSRCCPDCGGELRFVKVAV